MARQVARLLDRNGIHANRITNHATFRQTTTQIQYRQGYLTEAIALRDVLYQRSTFANTKVASEKALSLDTRGRLWLESLY